MTGSKGGPSMDSFLSKPAAFSLASFWENWALCLFLEGLSCNVQSHSNVGLGICESLCVNLRCPAINMFVQMSHACGYPGWTDGSSGRT